MARFASPPLAVALPIALLLVLAPTTPADAQEDFLARMEVEHRGDEPTPTDAAAAEPSVAVEAEEVAYAAQSAARGYLAYPADGPEPKAAIVLIHEWWGLNDNIRSVAERLAGEGYVALAVDLYEGASATDREEAARLARAARDDPERVRANLDQALDFLSHLGAERIGVIGWCFGGGWSLQTALMAPQRIDAAVVYYGRIPTEAAELEPLAAPLLGIFGELDGGIPPERVRAFEAALESLGKAASIHIYPDADHAFANPSGGRYVEAAAEDAWAKTLAFFAEHLR